jgi:hypothetical protein
MRPAPLSLPDGGHLTGRLPLPYLCLRFQHPRSPLPAFFRSIRSFVEIQWLPNKVNGLMVVGPTFSLSLRSVF